LLLLLVLICIFQVSKCTACTGCTSSGGISICSGSCSSECKPRYGDNQCYECNSITENDYYYIDPSGNCQLECQGDKIIENTKQCTDQLITTYTYQLGDAYFFSGTPSSTDSKYKHVSGKLYECKSYHIKKS
jgi:hypothetical protein